MKNTTKQKIVIIVLLLFSLNFFTMNRHQVNGDYTITPSDSFEYILEQSNWLIEFQNDARTGFGGTYNDLMIHDQSTFSIEAIAVSNEWGIDFEISNSSHSTTDSLTNDQFIFEFGKFVYYPLIECQRIVDEGFVIEEVEKGPPILPWFFVMPINSTWNFIENLTTLDYHNSLSYAENIEGYIQADYEKSNGEVEFDFNIQGTFVNLLNNSNLQMDHMIKFVWNATSGVLLGYRIATYFTGTYLGFQIKQEVIVVCSMVGYNLPNFNFISGFIPGFSYFITIIGIGAVAVVTMIILRKRVK